MRYDDGMIVPHVREQTSAMPAQVREHLSVLRCPRCAASLDIASDVGSLRCRGCSTVFSVEDGIPELFTAAPQAVNDVTERMQEFYEVTPFPNYEDLESIGDLVRKAEGGQFAKCLNEQLPFNIRMLEVGCGTGQLTNYLALAHRTVFGADMCRASLRLAEAFRARHGIARAGFYQMNLFAPPFASESFHVVICNGVLHHTSDPRGGFRSLAQLVKRGGYVLIGLYNRYGRLPTDARRAMFRFSGRRFAALDPQLRSCASSKKWEAWFRDQYENPHESKHTIGEVLQWFDREGFDFVYGVPNPKAFHGFASSDRMFVPHPKGTIFDHAMVQLASVIQGWREGGLFIMIGQRRTS